MREILRAVSNIYGTKLLHTNLESLHCAKDIENIKIKYDITRTDQPKRSLVSHSVNEVRYNPAGC